MAERLMRAALPGVSTTAFLSFPDGHNCGPRVCSGSRRVIRGRDREYPFRAESWRRRPAGVGGQWTNADLGGSDGSGADNGQSDRTCHRYRGSLQLLASENSGGTRSFPHILLHAGSGRSRKWRLRSSK